jgi:Na+-transporting methylmalonyl-CoA/oxaloacetate decarboxylase gamma subunit
MLLENLLAAAEHLAGFAIVMSTLAILWGLTALMGRVVARLEPTAHPASPQPGAKPIGATGNKEGEIDNDDLVVIAATAAAMLDARHRIVSIRPPASSWGQQGRRDIHASHRIR